MSDERVAAHINGFYILLAAIIPIALGTWFAVGGANGSGTPVKQAVPNEAEVADEPRVVQDSLEAKPIKVQQPETAADEIRRATMEDVIRGTPQREKSSISLFTYDAMHDDDNTSSRIKNLEAVDCCNGKDVEWVGYFSNLQRVDRDSNERYFLISIRSDPKWNWGAWCYLPKGSENVIASLAENQPIRISGMLESGTVFGKSIEVVETSSITIDDYLALLESETPFLEIQRQHLNKHVDWHAAVYDIDPYLDGFEPYYRLVLTPRSGDATRGYIYCKVNPAAASRLEGLHRGSPIRVAGILHGQSDLNLTGIMTE